VAEAVADCSSSSETTAVRTGICGILSSPGICRPPHPQTPPIQPMALLFGSEKFPPTKFLATPWLDRRRLRMRGTAYSGARRIAANPGYAPPWFDDERGSRRRLQPRSDTLRGCEHVRRADAERASRNASL